MTIATIDQAATVKTYTKQQALDNSFKAMGDELAAKVLVNKYLLCDQETYYESTPAEMWDRLAAAITEAEPANREYYHKRFRLVLDDFRFVPGGRILYALGNRFAKATLKNCYVIGFEEDSIHGIFQCAERMAETYKAGGGCGIDLSNLRPSGSPIRNAARIASGPVSFMELFSRITGTIGQRARIGALMICMDVSHPDIEEFVKIKGGDDTKLVDKANVSVKVTDEFMQAVEGDKDFDLRWNGKVYRTVRARDLWDLIIEKAWARGEPGLLFWDHTCREVPAHRYAQFRCIATNPCGEVPLAHGDACNLGSMNLSKYVHDPFKKSRFDFDGFTNDTKIAVRFLDNIITLEKSPLAFQQKANDDGRRLGLGIMGLADMLAKLQIRFDSDAALDCVDSVMQTFMNASYEASIELAEEKGSFPAFDSETHFKSDFIQRLPENLRERIRNTGLRNISVNAIAPTGTISLISSCSSGIEPIFMLEHVRKTNLGTAKKVEEHIVRHPCAQLYKNTVGAELPDYFVEAHDINPQYRVKLQGTIQKYIDQSISNTVNLPNDCPKEQVAFYYREAWRHGCKGITVYRDGCREGVLQAVGSSGNVDVGEIQRHRAPKRPEKLEGRVHIIKPNGKSYTVFVGLLKDRPYEVFALDNAMAGLPDGTQGHIVRERSDKPDSDNVYNFEKGALVVRMLNRYEDQEASLVTRLLSTSLRHGVPLEFLVDQMTKSKVAITSTAKAIGRALAAYIDPDEAKGSLKCPACRSKNIKLEGTCMACHDCGWTRCG